MRRRTSTAVSPTTRPPPAPGWARSSAPRRTRGSPTLETVLREDPDVVSLTDKFRNALDRKMEAELSAASSPGGLSSANATLAGARTQLYQGLEGKAEGIRPDASRKRGGPWRRTSSPTSTPPPQRNAAENLKRSIDSLTRSARSQPAANIELTRLQNDVERNRQLLQSFQAQMIASDISQAVETTDLGLRIEIVDPAQLPLEPSWPNRKKILVLAALLGPVLGVGFAFLSEMLDPTLRTLEDIQRVAPEPVLGTLPSARRDHDPADRIPPLLAAGHAGRSGSADRGVLHDPRHHLPRSRRVGHAGAGGGAGRGADAMRVLDAMHQDWPVATEVRKLQSRVWRLSRKEGLKTILVTSAVGGEGKTTTVAYLAATIALHPDRKVLAVDCDFRRPHLHTHFDLEPGLGFADLLQGRCTEEEAIQTDSAAEPGSAPGGHAARIAWEGARLARGGAGAQPGCAIATTSSSSTPRPWCRWPTPPRWCRSPTACCWW